MNKQDLLNALHGIQLWGIVKQTKDPHLGKGRCGSNDEFLKAYKVLENEIEYVISENEQLEQKNEELCNKLERYGICSGGIIMLFAEGIKERDTKIEKLQELVQNMWICMQNNE